jgi:mannose-1-phosphate guanylyltransferase
MSQTILGWGSSVGRWVRIEGVSVFGKETHIDDELFLKACFALPFQSITNSIHKKNTVVM